MCFLFVLLLSIQIFLSFPSSRKHWDLLSVLLRLTHPHGTLFLSDNHLQQTDIWTDKRDHMKWGHHVPSNSTNITLTSLLLPQINQNCLTRPPAASLNVYHRRATGQSSSLSMSSFVSLRRLLSWDALKATGPQTNFVNIKHLVQTSPTKQVFVFPPLLGIILYDDMFVFYMMQHWLIVSLYVLLQTHFVQSRRFPNKTELMRAKLVKMGTAGCVWVGYRDSTAPGRSLGGDLMAVKGVDWERLNASTPSELQHFCKLVKCISWSFSWVALVWFS